MISEPYAKGGLCNPSPALLSGLVQSSLDSVLGERAMQHLFCNPPAHCVDSSQGDTLDFVKNEVQSFEKDPGALLSLSASIFPF